MNTSQKKTINHEDFDEGLIMQKLLDDELSPELAELVFYHAESCPLCAEKFREAAEINAFCREAFAAENEAMLPLTTDAVNRVRKNLDTLKIQNAKSSKPGFLKKFSGRLNRRFSLPFAPRYAIAFVCLIAAGLFVLSFLFSSKIGQISADEILSESEKSTAVWKEQRGKILNWQINFERENDPSMKNGKFTSFFWQNNLGDVSERIVKNYNSDNFLIWGIWNRADGSQVIYERESPEREAKLQVTPSTREMTKFAETLSEDKKRILLDYAANYNVSEVSPDASTGEAKQKLFGELAANAEVNTVFSSDVGKIFVIKVARHYPVNDMLVRTEIEEEISADTFMKLSRRTRTHFPDGRVASDSMTLGMKRETDIKDFKANDFSQQLETSANVTYITPLQMLQTAEKIEESVKKATAAKKN